MPSGPTWTLRRSHSALSLSIRGGAGGWSGSYLDLGPQGNLPAAHHHLQGLNQGPVTFGHAQAQSPLRSEILNSCLTKIWFHMLRTASKQLNKVVHTAPETAKRVKSSEQNFDKMAVKSLSKIESTDCFEYCSEFFSKISVGAD